MRPTAWTINGDFASLKPTGVARYAHETLRALDRLVADRHPATYDLALTLVVKTGAASALSLQAIPVIEVPDMWPRLPQVWVQAILPRHMRGGLLSLCNIGPLVVRKQILCIHDVHPFVVPESYSRSFRRYARLVLPQLGRRVRHITTVSEHSASTLVKHGVADRDRISVTFNGHEHVRAVDRGVAAPNPLSSRPYVLAIARDLAYKNSGLYFSIAETLDRLGIDILLAGQFDAARYFSGSAQMPSNIALLGRVVDADLFAFMRGALCFLFPSRAEGFGLPAVEAMAVDCPLVVSSSPCLPEICGRAAIVVDPDDVDGWIGAVASLHADPARRNALVERARELRTLYSWTKIGHHYLDLMRYIDGPTVTVREDRLEQAP